ncbi:amidase [Rhizodiscina lignyota]|uniref:Amidase n=1 Tax=Rhizodiscina lignyota TaxID=1504668 RepID=A0A9P4IAZ8_9PEZI|nr:amidase [Rhizodiscina lignyota]
MAQLARRPLLSSSTRCIVPSLTSRRSFHASPRWNLRTTEMSEKDLGDLKVSQKRLMEELQHSCKWGTGKRYGDGPNETGMSRLSLSDGDNYVRDWFVDTMRSLNCTTTIDAMGNIFAVRPGLRNDVPPTFAGSHLDTQPSGGRYDGILGVLAGMEMIRVLNDNWVETEFPVGVVNWTNEEGARFPLSMCASGVWAGATPIEEAYNLHSVIHDNATMKAELERIGYLGETPCSYEAMPMAAHFELHIEQGPILEAEKRKVGAVVGVQAYKWFTVQVTGRDAHTGTTPLENRADALLASARMMQHAHRAATKYGARASTGILTLEPGSTNTIPGSVRFSLDVRAPSDEIVAQVEEHCREAFTKIGAHEGVQLEGKAYDYTEGGTKGLPCGVEWTVDSVSPAVNFHPDCITCVKESAAGLFGASEVGTLTKDMVSGAGHDSVHASKRCPTSMIFVPCRNGVSHNPEEYATDEDCAIGAQVLTGAVVRYDRLRAKKEPNLRV